MLTFMEVHLYYTLPVLGILLALHRPFDCAQERLKYLVLCGVAFSVAVPWDSYIVLNRVWRYCPKCVTMVIGYLPLEKYMSFVIMTLITASFTNLVMRWHLPAFYLKPTSSRLHSVCIQYIPILALVTLGVKSWSASIPDTPFFYGACILWLATPVLAVLWYGAGEYICRRWRSVLVSIIFPTLYSCWVDHIALGASTWTLSERTSTHRLLGSTLPLEEIMLFLLVNTILVFASCAIDRAYAVVHLYRPGPPNELRCTVVNLLKAFCLSDQQLDPKPLDDLQHIWRILKDGSASFYTASAVFPSNARQDLGVLYAFCRATDDLADNEQVPVDQRKRQLEVVREFVNDLFTQKSNCASDMDWAAYEDHLPNECLASFRSLVRLRHVLQVDNVLELLDGYTWDLERRPVLTETDLIRYSECVASSVGEMCTRILMNSSNNKDPTTLAWTVHRARDMGLVLQFTNIARDIVTDSQQLNRSYLPTDWLNDNEIDLIKAGKARQLGDQRLRQLSLRLVHMADDINVRARRGINKLPPDCQGGVRAACAVYCAIGKALKDHDGYPMRAHVKRFKRAWITLQSVYNTPLTTK